MWILPALTRICGYGLWLLPVVVMGCGFCGGGGSLGLTRIVAGGGCRRCVGFWHGFVTFVAGLLCSVGKEKKRKENVSLFE